MFAAITSFLSPSRRSVPGGAGAPPPPPGKGQTPGHYLEAPSSPSSDEEVASPLPPPGTPGSLRNDFAKVTFPEQSAALVSFRPAVSCDECVGQECLCLWSAATARQGVAKCGRCKARKKVCTLSASWERGITPARHPDQPPQSSLPRLGFRPVMEADCPPAAASWPQLVVDNTPNRLGRDKGRKPRRPRQRSESPTPAGRPARPVRERSPLQGARAEGEEEEEEWGGIPESSIPADISFVAVEESEEDEEGIPAPAAEEEAEEEEQELPQRPSWVAINRPPSPRGSPELPYTGGR